MADYDRRGPRRGGQFNNRKRRHREDDFDDRRPQRRRYEEPLAVKLRKQVLDIAENPVRRAEEDVAHIASKIAENYFDTDITSMFLDLAVRLSLEQPLKIPFLAAIVTLCNAQKPEFTSEVLKRVGDALQENVTSGSWREVKLLLRFLGCLQGLFEADGIFSVLEELFSRAADLQTKSSEDALGLELVKIILFTIPYTMASSATGFEDYASSLLEKTDIIASTPHILENLVDPFPPVEVGAGTSAESALSLMQKHMAQEAKNGWELACLPRPWKAPVTSDEENPLTAAAKHPFPAITLPQELQMGSRLVFPGIYFSVYAEQDLETVPKASDPGALLIRDAITDTIEILDYNRAVAAKFLIELDSYFAPNTFVKRATPFDKLRDVTGSDKSWKPEDVVVDAAFALLMQLPAPEHKLIYYHSVLTESCKLAPAAVAPSLGRAIRFLYRTVDRLDLELAQRFLDWFTHHLSNFGFTWKWTEWVDDTGLPNVHPRKAFIVDALDKEIRLSFAQRIKGTLPEQYQSLIPVEKDKESPDFKFDDDATPFAADGRDMTQKIKQKASDEEIQALLSKVEQDAANSGLPNPPLVATDVLVHAICHVGSKSLSHVVAIVERCKDRLLAIRNSEPAAQTQIITSVMEHWKFQTGTGIAILDKLLNYQILTPQAIVEWALIDKVDRGTLLARAWCYELVARTMQKSTGRVHALVAKIRDPLLSEDDRSTLKTALDHEITSMKELFGAVEDACSSIATASQDGMIESSDQLRAEEEDLVKEWGRKWVRVFRRRVAVEETWVREELARPLPPKPEIKDVNMQDDNVQTNGGHAGVSAGNLAGASNGADDMDAIS